MPRHRKIQRVRSAFLINRAQFCSASDARKFLYSSSPRRDANAPAAPNLEAKNEARAPVTHDFPYAFASAFSGDRHGGCGPWRAIRRCGAHHLGRWWRRRVLERPRELGRHAAQHGGRCLCRSQHGSARRHERSGLAAGRRHRRRRTGVSDGRKPDYRQLRAGQWWWLKRVSRIGGSWRRQRLELHERHDRQGRQQHGVRDGDGSGESARSSG
ncbi:Uncharacterised protein [Achromobacter denitrificans]|nr:Uncharacterised protein [Achromobacter denitrificans]